MQLIPPERDPTLQPVGRALQARDAPTRGDRAPASSRTSVTDVPSMPQLSRWSADLGHN